MADCSACERQRAAAQPELTSEQQTFLLALESKDARYHKLIRWIVEAFIICMLLMAGIFMFAWTQYDYYGEDTDVENSGDGIAAYIGDRGLIINGENSGSAEITD